MELIKIEKIMNGRDAVQFGSTFVSGTNVA